MKEVYREASRKLVLGVHPNILYRKYRRALLAVTIAVASTAAALAVCLLLGEPVDLILSALLAVVWGLAFFAVAYALAPVLKLKAYESALQEEAVWGIFAGTVYALAGVPPLKILDFLEAKTHVFPHLSHEIKRIKRDSRLKMESFLDALRREYRSAKGFWRMLLGTIITLETTGGDLSAYFRDLYKSCIRELKTRYENQAKVMNSLSSATTVFLAVLPMSVYVMLVVVASKAVVPAVTMFTLINIATGVAVAALADFFAPKTGDLFTKIYGKVLLKYLPLGACVGASCYLGLLNLPLSLKFPGLISLTLGTLAFTAPAYLEYRKHAKAVDETVENLPVFLRDIADEVKRGYSPIQALSTVHESKSYGKYFDRLLRLLVNKIRLQGVREALLSLEPYLPKQVFFSLDLLADADEIGARAEVFDVLADIMHDWVSSMRAYKASVKLSKYTSLFAVACAAGITVFLFGSVVGMVAKAGDIVRGTASTYAPVAVDIVTSDQVPVLKNTIFTALAVTAVVLGVVEGKVSSFRFGEGLRETVIMVSTVLFSVVFGTLLGLI